MRISWLLFTKSLHQNWRRLVLVSLSVAIGVVMLLSFTAMFNAVTNPGPNWRRAVVEASNTATIDSNGVIHHSEVLGVDPVYVQYSTLSNGLHRWRDKDVTVIHMAASGTQSPDVSGIVIPAKGEYHVSPALDEIMHQHPEDTLGKRYGSKQIGVLPGTMLRGRDELLVIAGGDLSELKQYRATPVYSFVPHDPRSQISPLIMAVLYLGIFILLFPVILLVSIAAQLGNVQREQRYAALRLVGATKRQITLIITIESLMAALAGIAMGVLAYFTVRPLMSDFTLSDIRYLSKDITVVPWQFGAIFASTLAMVVFANWWGMRHVRTSPLGVVSRQKTAKNPRLWRVLPLIVGLSLLVYLRYSVKKDQAGTETTYGLIGAFMLIMIGLVLSGPWLTWTVSKIMARFARRPSVLIGTRYISAHASKISRSVIGVVIALFAGSFYLTTVSGIGALELESVSNYSRLKNGVAVVYKSGADDQFTEKLRSQSYVSGVEKIGRVFGTVSVMSCSTAKAYLQNTDCPTGAGYVGIDFMLPTKDSASIVFGKSEKEVIDTLIIANGFAADSEWAIEPEYLVRVPSGNVEQLRTLVIASTTGWDNNYVQLSQYYQRATLSPTITALSGLTYVGMIATMLVATISLTISTMGGLIERKRSLFTLRLGGMQISQLKAMVVVESLIPLVATSVLAAGLGVWVGVMFMDMVSKSLDAVVSPIYAVVLLASLAVATVAIWLILPMIRRLTSLETNRSE